MVDPLSFDSLNRNFVYSEHALKIEAGLYHSIQKEYTDTIHKGDTIIYQGKLSNGSLWKEKSYKRTKICYINVTEDQMISYDKRINSFIAKK